MKPGVSIDLPARPWRVFEGGNFLKVVPSDFPEQPQYLGGAVCDVDDTSGAPGRWTKGHFHAFGPAPKKSARAKRDQMLAVANLIAAAPELLDVCITVLTILEDPRATTSMPITALRAAIQKAKGGK